MRRLFPILATVHTAPVFAEGFDRPIPQAQSATAEFWYAMACITLVLGMAAVHWLVKRR